MVIAAGMGGSGSPAIVKNDGDAVDVRDSYVDVTSVGTSDGGTINATGVVELDTRGAFGTTAAVDNELAQIQAIGGGELFLNDAFILDQVRRAAVQQEVPGVVHLATHAVFTGNPDTSFLLTYGGRVRFDDLSDVVSMTRDDGAPLDLLVLSACETAVGNDRAGLGFSGSAIRAGARRALGSLWPISDAAAGELMVNFYRGLQASDLSKAEALQQAQAGLRDSDRFAHPFYWAPFTLVNDWL